VAGLLAVSSAICFATGYYRLAGVFFIARYFTDCLDGKVARAQGSSSARGAMLDLVADVAGISLVVAALSWNLLDRGLVSAVVPLTLLAAMVYYNWALAYRKQLARSLGQGSGGADHSAPVRIPVVGGWVALCQRLGMVPAPWTVEAEIAVLGLAPLLLTPAAVGRVMAIGAVFYLVADLVNTRRLWRLTGLSDDGE
jgi:phosphatidylglycerophosphate synthase